jgi:hypothetical protein
MVVMSDSLNDAMSFETKSLAAQKGNDTMRFGLHHMYLLQHGLLLLPPLFAGRRLLFPQSLVHCVNRLLKVVLQLFARRSAVWSLRQSNIKPRVNKTPLSEAGTERMNGKQQATNARRHA